MIALLFAFATCFTTQAQSPMAVVAIPTDNTAKEDVIVSGAFGETVCAPSATSNELLPGFYRTAKPMAGNFTGYTVQIIATEVPLDKNNPVFAEFGGIMYQEMLTPRYCYFIGNFKTEEGAQKYLDTVLRDRFVNALVIPFENGKRVKK